MTAYTEKYTDHETRVALAWLRDAEDRAEKGREIISLTNSFDAIVETWIEEGKLRLNCRKIDRDKTKAIALRFMNHGMFPKTMEHYQKLARREALAKELEAEAAKEKPKRIARKFVVYSQLGYGQHGEIKFLKSFSNGLAQWTKDKSQARQYPTSQGAKRIASMACPAYVMRVGSEKWKNLPAA